MLYGILNILFGALVLSPSFVAQERRRKYARAISWAGIIVLLWGIMGVASALMFVSTLAVAPFYWTLWIAGGTASLLMGIILVAGLLKRSAEGIANKVLPCQTVVVILAIIIGIVQLFVSAPAV
ncbi:MAG: hypothetical protein LBD21_10205 [Tannerellaceae bacterium]|jgi:hypothetical protein|nr:hypothetical protein [Tannerellaceae bacterium]